MKCAECKFWRADDRFDPTDGGECRRRAPAPLSEAATVIHAHQRALAMGLDLSEDGTPPTCGGWENQRAIWPWTIQTDFCGEFVPKNGRVGFV